MLAGLIYGSWLRANGSRFMVKNVLRVVWLFCCNLFVQQRGNKA